jgi:amino acid adenylation domain-containing protein
VEFATDLWTKDSMERLLRAYRRALQSLLDAGDETPVGALEVLAAEDRAHALSLVDTTPRDFGRTASALFERWAASAPDALAVTDGNESLSYQQLNVRANRLANRLRAGGVGPEALVAVYCERSLDMVVALIAIHKAGAAYVPLDPDHPAERTQLILEDAEPLALVTQTALLELCPRREGMRIVLADDATLAGESVENPGLACTAKTLAYVIFTSGSTGKPKGVEIEQGAFTNFVESMARVPGLGPSDRILAVTTLTFDIAGLELWLPLTVGASIEVVDRDTASQASRLQERLADPSITLMQATPATWRMLLESGWQGRRSLRVLCGGEALAPDLIAALLERVGELWNVYGPTETTVWSTLQRLTSATVPVSIGRPIDNTSVYLLNPQLQPVPPGAVGEIYIGGAGVARGYRKRPELTRERFVPDPFASTPGARLYRTGDLGRMLPDGTLTCLGRIDFQVKIRGFRIELGEIEAVLIDCPEVRQAVAVAREDSPGDVRLVAYVVPASGHEDVAPRALREQLERRLPVYMVPSAFVVMKALPLNPSGKIDRKALPMPSAAARVGADPGAGPADDLEASLHEAWCETLGLDQIGVDQNFFDLGGHSLLAVRLVNKIEQRLGKKIPLGYVFQSPTIRGLATRLRQKDPDFEAPQVVTLRRGSGEGCVFCISGIALYQALARALPPERTVYGVYVPAEGRILTEAGGSGTQAPSVEELAASYVSAIRSVQPRGPYALCGISFGAVVAFEVAQQVSAAGEKIDMLALLDPLLPGADGRGPLGRIAVHARDFIRSPESRQAWLKIALGSRFPRPMSAWSSDEVVALRNAVHALRLERYVRRVRPFRGDALIFGALDRSDFGGKDVDAAAGWKRLIQGALTVYGVRGGHLGILEAPQVADLARLLAQHLPGEGSAA